MKDNLNNTDNIENKTQNEDKQKRRMSVVKSMASKFLLCFCFLLCFPLMFVERQEAIYISFVFMYVLRANRISNKERQHNGQKKTGEAKKTTQWPKEKEANSHTMVIKTLYRKQKILSNINAIKI